MRKRHCSFKTLCFHSKNLRSPDSLKNKGWTLDKNPTVQPLLVDKKHVAQKLNSVMSAIANLLVASPVLKGGGGRTPPAIHYFARRHRDFAAINVLIHRDFAEINVYTKGDPPTIHF